MSFGHMQPFWSGISPTAQVKKAIERKAAMTYKGKIIHTFDSHVFCLRFDHMIYFVAHNDGR